MAAALVIESTTPSPVLSRDPRTVRSRAAVLQATVELMVERGVHTVSVDAIVERSGVAKTTVYRHWPTREALMMAAWQTLVSTDDVDPSGTMHEQLRTLALAFAVRLGTPPMSLLLPDLMAASARDPKMRAMYDEVVRSRRRPVVETVEAGIAAGLLPASTDAEFVCQLILGPIAYEQLLRHVNVDPAFVDRLVSVVLEAANHNMVCTTCD